MKPPKPPKMPKMPFPMPRFDAVTSFLNSRNAREKYMLITFFGVFLFVADYFIWLSPVFEIYNQASPKIGVLREELKQLKEDQKNKDEIRTKWEKAKEEIGRKDRMFIAPNETPALLENLSRQAQRSGVKILSLEPFDIPKTASARGSYTPLPIQLNASAGTHEFGAFLSNLESGGTFFRIKDLRIASNPSNERKHTIELSMEAYKREK